MTCKEDMTMDKTKNITPREELKDEALDQVAGGSLMPKSPEWANPNTEPEASGLLEMGKRPE